jgi:hypothetical protein
LAISLSYITPSVRWFGAAAEVERRERADCCILTQLPKTYIQGTSFASTISAGRSHSFAGVGARETQVLWDVHKLQKENGALLNAVETQAAHRETLQQQVGELKARLAGVPAAEAAAHAARAENFAMACQLRAALQRLEGALAEHASMQLQLSDQRELVEHLEAACKEAAQGGGGVSGVGAEGPSQDADVLRRLRGMAATVEAESNLDCSPVVTRLAKELELSRCRGAAPASADDVDVGGAWAQLTAAHAAEEAAHEARTHLQSRVEALEAAVVAAAAAEAEAAAREGVEHAAHAAEVKQLRREVAQVHVWLDEALSQAEAIRRDKDALKRTLATRGAAAADDTRAAALMQQQAAVTRRQDEMLQVFSDEKVANRGIRVWRGATENGPWTMDESKTPPHDCRSCRYLTLRRGVLDLSIIQ